MSPAARGVDPAIAHLRLTRQGLRGAGFASARDAVAWLVAVQAQDYPLAQWSVAQRAPGATASDLEQACTDGVLLRTHVLRPTWHFVTPADIRWLLALTGPRVQARNGPIYRREGLDDELRARSRAVIGAALAGGQWLTRAELGEALGAAGIPATGLRLGYLMSDAELEAVICSGGRRGKQFTYALLEERAPTAPVLEREEALAQLTARYFASRGPATVHDMARWSGLTVSDVRRGLAAVAGDLEMLELGGVQYWQGPGAGDGALPERPTAFLLSIYDELIAGYRDRDAIVTPGHGALLLGMGSALRGVALVDDEIAGTWRQSLVGRDRMALEVRPFAALGRAALTELRAAAVRYGEFLGRVVELDVLPAGVA